MWNKIKPYLGYIALTLGVGGLAAFLTRGNMNIYDDIISPPLSPPMWLFPVVWSILYILMGTGAARVREKYGELGTFFLQLAVNFLWSIIFFNLRMFLFSSLWLVLLIVLIVKMIGEFSEKDKLSGYLQIPYLIWCLFALYLNIGIYLLN